VGESSPRQRVKISEGLMIWLGVGVARSIQYSLIQFGDGLMLIDANLPIQIGIVTHTK
jgi:hypothetical protein